jgi:hypothetical protein
VTISFALDVEIGEEPLLIDLITEAESHTGIQCRDEDIRLHDDGAEEYEPTVGVALFENGGVVKIEVYDASEVSRIMIASIPSTSFTQRLLRSSTDGSWR